MFFKIHKFQEAKLHSLLNKIDIMWPGMADVARQQDWRVWDYDYRVFPVKQCLYY